MASRHQELEARSLALHAAVAENIRESPELVGRARSRVAAWRSDGSVHPAYARAWEEALSGPVEELPELLADPGERARAMRQVSPFAGVLDHRRRWEILRDAGVRC